MRSDDTASFVRQQYHDFLNRDADAAGLAFWKNNIDKCNDPAQTSGGTDPGAVHRSAADSDFGGLLPVD